MAVVYRKPKAPTGEEGKTEIPAGLFAKCKSCGEMITQGQLEENLKVCSKCNYHFPLGARERIASLVDPNSFEERDGDLVSVDVLQFTGVAAYPDKLRADSRKTGLRDAVITGTAKLGDHAIALGVMDFNFMGGSMGSVVGEKLTRLIEHATDKKLPLIIISASGGARMYEGMLSLMQMAKTSGALALHAQKNVPYISVLTHPTTAGVMASYASLGDVIVAEPKALVGFAGPRVIKETTQSALPEGFQTAEFLLDHGFIDVIVPRKQMKQTLTKLLDYLCGGAKK